MKYFRRFAFFLCILALAGGLSIAIQDATRIKTDNSGKIRTSGSVYPSNYENPTYIISSNTYLVSANFVNGKIEIIRRHPSNSMYACIPPRPVPDSITKEIYCAKDGKIVLEKTISGTVIPSETIPEKIVFENDKK